MWMYSVRHISAHLIAALNTSAQRFTCASAEPSHHVSEERALSTTSALTPDLLVVKEAQDLSERRCWLIGALQERAETVIGAREVVKPPDLKISLIKTDDRASRRVIETEVMANDRLRLTSRELGDPLQRYAARRLTLWDEVSELPNEGAEVLVFIKL